jgi:hypothetical protein
MVLFLMDTNVLAEVILHISIFLLVLIIILSLKVMHHLIEIIFFFIILDLVEVGRFVFVVAVLVIWLLVLLSLLGVESFQSEQEFYVIFFFGSLFVSGIASQGLLLNQYLL